MRLESIPTFWETIWIGFLCHRNILRGHMDGVGGHINTFRCHMDGVGVHTNILRGHIVGHNSTLDGYMYMDEFVGHSNMLGHIDGVGQHTLYQHVGKPLV